MEDTPYANDVTILTFSKKSKKSFFGKLKFKVKLPIIKKSYFRVIKMFIGRVKELKKLQLQFDIGRSSLAVIKGRRRIGKSRLIQEFAKNKHFWAFSGLAPTPKATLQDQLDHFCTQLCHYAKLPPFTVVDWDNAFQHLTLHLTKEPTVILLDEISWMALEDPNFVGKLKDWWDLNLHDKSQFMLVLCGSVSTWVEDNILNSTALFGRIHLQITLNELSLKESYQFLKTNGFRFSNYDAYKILAITGGIPWYLEQISPNQTPDENIKRLCFEADGLFVLEFKKLFHDLFHQRGLIYKTIVKLLSNGMLTYTEIQKKSQYSQGGTLTKALQQLVTCGFVSLHKSWSIKTGEVGKKNLYRLSDNYLRFYFKYIEPSINEIEKNRFTQVSLESLPGWDIVMGLQVENFVVNNRIEILKCLGVSMENVVIDNPYYQKSTHLKKGCQIDYLIQTRTKNLFVCELKFSRRQIRSTVIEEMQDKIKSLSFPKGFGVCPVLIHIGEIAPAIHESKYFYRIIDMEDLLSF
jgi:AAA+ ATPase superfamily predicted ATPase